MQGKSLQAKELWAQPARGRLRHKLTGRGAYTGQAKQELGRVVLV